MGGGSNGIPSTPLLIPQPVSSSHSCITNSNSKTATTTINGSRSTPASSRNGSGTPKVSKNNGLGRKVTEEVGAGMSEEDQGCNRMISHAPERNGDPSETVNQPSQCGEYSTDYHRTGNSSVQANKPLSWGDWIQVSYGKEDAWRPYVAHPSVYPLQHSGRIPYQYGSPRHLQASHMTTPQSWTQIGWPLILPHDQSHSLRNTSPTFNRNTNQSLLLSHPAYSPHKYSTYNGTQFHTVNQSQPLTQNHHSAETSCKTSHSRSTAAQTNGNSCPSATPSNSCSNIDTGTNTTAALSSKTNSPLSTPSSMANRKPCPPSLPGNGIEQQTPYGYVNQQHMIMMPYYQYGGSVAPYCNWAAPVVMQWPMAQSPSFHSTPNNSVGMAAQPKSLENCLPHTALTFPPQNEKHMTSTSFQTMTPKFKEVLSPASNSIPFSKSGRGGHMSYSRNRSDRGLHSPTYNASPERLCKQSEQKMEHLKGSVSSFPHMFSSMARRAAMSPSKFPRPLAPNHSQTGPPGKGFSSNSGVNSSVKTLAGQEEHCSTVPMTPPATPLPNIDEISDPVENISAS